MKDNNTHMQMEALMDSGNYLRTGMTVLLPAEEVFKPDKDSVFPLLTVDFPVKDLPLKLDLATKSLVLIL